MKVDMPLNKETETERERERQTDRQTDIIKSLQKEDLII